MREPVKRQYYFATWLRVAGVFLILMCHFVQQSSNVLLVASGQLFNIGVQIFIILSGFLFGVGGEIRDAQAWYRKRIKRIYVPYELFIIILFLIHLFCKLNLLDLDWIWLVLGLQGSVVGVLGAEQTWFITPLLICYSLTPELYRFISENCKKGRMVLLVVVTAILPLMWALFPSPVYHTLLSLISYYILAFVMGRYYNKLKITKKWGIFAFVVMCGAFCIRLIGRYFYDGTILYERIICGYSQCLAAFCIFYIFSVLFGKRVPLAPVSFLSEISFEIYLVHYMFCVGPVRMFTLTSSWGVNCVIVTIVSIILAFIIHQISRRIILKLR